MKKQIGKVTLDKYEIEYIYKNNGKKNTVLFVHGVNSSYDFIEGIEDKMKNYNYIAINLPINSNNVFDTPAFSLEELTNSVEEIIKIIRTPIYLFGHSLAGGIVSSLKRSKKIKKMFFMSTISPGMVTQKNYNMGMKFLFPEGKLGKATSALILKSVTSLAKTPEAKYFINIIISKESGYRNIIRNSLFNTEFMTKELSKNYLKWKDKSIYLIGEKDIVINPEKFKWYISSIGGEVIFIQDSAHNPIKDNPMKVLEVMDANIPNKKRFFGLKRKIIKNKK